MARGGQNVKPVKDHEAKGNYRPVRHQNRIQEVSKVVESIPKAPKHFDKRHADKWAEVCKNLYDLTILKTVDLDLVEKYVVNWFVSHDAWQEVQREGITQDGKKHPAINVMNDAQKVVITVGSLFGFNPRARMGIKTEEKKSSDPFEEFLTNN
jgi:P27 family predicted phage terminase small subunit